jgi:CRP/FNR family transcriptional regulator, nitrogen oxide reductase regulator
MKNEDALDFFKLLTPADIAKLKHYAVEKCFKKGSTIFSEGDNPGTLWLLLEGWVHMTSEVEDGKSTIHQVHSAGSVFCIPSVIMKCEYRCSAIAATPVRLLAIPVANFQQLFEKLPKMAQSLLKLMAPRVREAHHQCDYCFSPVEQRLADVLVRLAGQFGNQYLPFTRLQLAQMAGTTVETTSRCLSQWRKQGVIASTRGRIKIVKTELLAGLAGH